MLIKAEKLLDSKALRMREKLIQEIYQESGLKVGFTQKNCYLEQRIETVQKYFEYMNDLNFKGATMM